MAERPSGSVVRRTFRSLGEPNYRLFFVGNTSSVIGTWIQRVGQDWLVLELTDSALALGGSMLCQFLPVLLGGAWGGVIIDRTDTRRLIMVTQAAQALLAVALAVFALTGTATLPIVYALALGLGVTMIVDNPARQAFVSELVDAPNVVNAQAMNSLINNVGRLFGPALGGLLIVWLGVGVTFVVNAVSFVAVLASLFRMDVARLRPVPVAPKAPGQVREGLRYVWSHAELRVALVLIAVVSVFGQNFRVVFPVLATQAYGGDARTYGWLTAALGAGAIMGALVSAAATTATSWRMMWVCCAFAAGCMAVAAAPVLSVALGAIVVLGAFNILFNTVARTLLQLDAAPAMRGRVMAIYSMVFLGGTPIGGPLVGVFIELWGVRWGMAVSGAACLLGCAAVAPVLVRLHRAGAHHADSGGEEEKAHH